MQSIEEFKQKFTFEERCNQTNNIILKYPNRIPIFVSRSCHNDCPQIDRNKFLVPNDLTIGQFMFVIRKRIKLSPEKSIYLFVNNKVPTTSSLLSQIYENNKNQDGFLYITYSGESTFG